MEVKKLIENEPLLKQVVKVCFKICKIGEICDLKEVFYAKVIVEAKWKLNDNIGETKYSPDTHWNPHLIIENTVDVKENIIYELSTESDAQYVTEIRETSGKF